MKKKAKRAAVKRGRPKVDANERRVPVSFSIPQRIVVRIQEAEKASGRSRSEILVEILGRSRMLDALAGGGR
jgi:hypothetical protein